ncbi:unnamed protein product [Brassicogethes aeneus]|uniref:Uncharacterized protein n=1 Tax=Brassicogethes aeneus TaxID=1431903 RepID=A0A9P0FJQ1_BRAAE|nr:unnamed protein product [Brassicogethes aeneus]
MTKNMSEHGAALQTYNQELVKCLEELKIKKKDVLILIEREENEKKLLEKNIKGLQEKLTLVNNNLQHHKSLCDNYERTIRDTEHGFKKILESSQALLHLAQHEAVKLDNTQKVNIL